MTDRELLQHALDVIEASTQPHVFHELKTAIFNRLAEPVQWLTAQDLADAKKLGALSWEESARLIERVSLMKNHVL